MALTEKISRLFGRNEATALPTDVANPERMVAMDETPAPTPDAPQEATEETAAPASLRERVIEVLKTVYDPEIPVDIYELGLVYEVEVRDESNIFIQMTLTSPMCPVAEILPQEVEEKARSVDGVDEVKLDLVWDPPWNPDMMSEAAKLTLNF